MALRESKNRISNRRLKKYNFLTQYKIMQKVITFRYFINFEPCLIKN